MIFFSSDEKEINGDRTIIITCNCGCNQEIHITKSIYNYDDNGEEKETTNYYLSTHSANWYTEQDGIGKIIWKRIKRAWSALRGKDYLYQDVCMTKEEFNQFCNYLRELE